MSKTIGIDLGTTNSCVAYIEGGEPTVIVSSDGSRTTPSVVAFSKNGERMVGQVAKRQAITNSARTVSSIKRQMGSDYRVQIDGKSYTPQEISAMILQKLKTDAEAFLRTWWKCWPRRGTITWAATISTSASRIIWWTTSGLPPAST